jgi:hypothetical protein
MRLREHPILDRGAPRGRQDLALQRAVDGQRRLERGRQRRLACRRWSGPQLQNLGCHKERRRRGAGVVCEFFIRDRLGELSIDIALFMQHLQPEFLPPGYMLRLWNTRLLSVRLRQHDVLHDRRRQIGGLGRPMARGGPPASEGRHDCKPLGFKNAGGGSRTHTPLLATDFECEKQGVSCCVHPAVMQIPREWRGSVGAGFLRRKAFCEPIGSQIWPFVGACHSR